MAAVFPLEDFGDAVHGLARTNAGTDAIEEARAMGYEEGYRSGWDDAVAAGADRDNQISEEFARNLQDLGFTYHEARAHVVDSVSGLLKDFVDAVLPGTISEAVGLHFLAQLSQQIETLADSPVRIIVSPEDSTVLSRLVEAETALPVRIEEEAALAAGQAYFRFGALETRIDLTKISTALRSALDAAQSHNERVLNHG